MNSQNDNDFPVLTDVIANGIPSASAASADDASASSSHFGERDNWPAHDAQAAMHGGDHAHGADGHALKLQQIEATLSERLIAELSVQVPVLIEAALREHLPNALGARLQAEILTILTNALPIAAQATAAELSARLAYEVGGLLEQRLQDEVRRAVADEIARLTGQG